MTGVTLDLIQVLDRGYSSASKPRKTPTLLAFTRPNSQYKANNDEG